MSHLGNVGILGWNVGIGVHFVDWGHIRVEGHPLVRIGVLDQRDVLRSEIHVIPELILYWDHSNIWSILWVDIRVHHIHVDILVTQIHA